MSLIALVFSQFDLSHRLAWILRRASYLWHSESRSVAPQLLFTCEACLKPSADFPYEIVYTMSPVAISHRRYPKRPTTLNRPAALDPAGHLESRCPGCTRMVRLEEPGTVARSRSAAVRAADPSGRRPDRHADSPSRRAARGARAGGAPPAAPLPRARRPPGPGRRRGPGRRLPAAPRPVPAPLAGPRPRGARTPSERAASGRVASDAGDGTRRQGRGERDAKRGTCRGTRRGDVTRGT